MGSSAQSALLAALLDRVGPLAEEMVATTRAEVPGFAAVPRDEHLADTARSIEWLARYALERPVPELDLARLEEIGARRAGQGVPVEDLHRAWRLSVRIGTDQARGLAEELELDPAVVIDVFQGALRAADQALVPLAGGYREAEALEPGRGREQFAVAALLGQLPSEKLRAQGAALGLDMTASYRAVRAGLRAGGEVDGAGPAEPWQGRGDLAVGLTAIHEGELIGFAAAGAEIERGAAELVALGSWGTIDELPASFAAAGRVLNAGRSLGLAGVHDLASAALFVAVFESGDAGDALVARYVEPVVAASSGADLLATVRVWQEAGMRAEMAAERLHIHPNTLRYRLGRFEQLTGADLSDTEEIVSVWIALSRSRPAGMPDVA